MRKITLVVLSRYPDLFEGFKKSIEAVHPGIRKVLVRDGHQISKTSVLDTDCHPWKVIQGIEPFVFARNMNMGWDAAKKDDIIIAGDDVRFSHPFVDILRAVAYSDKRIGFAVPELGGQSCFVCAFIKRDLIDEVGRMDERFTGYGMEDVDYYKRFEAKGWRTQPTTAVKVHHIGGATSFYRRAAEGGVPVQLSNDANRELFNQKWGL